MPKTSHHHKLLIMILIGVVFGGIVGSFFPSFAVKTGFLGELFLNALKMMVIPLIVTSLIVGVTNLGDVRKLGTLGMRTLSYYLITTGIAVAIGIVLVSLISPGSGVEMFAGDLPERIRDKENFSFVEVLHQLIHPNPIQAAAEFKILPIIVISLFFGVALTLLGEEAAQVNGIFYVLNEAVMKIIHAIILFAPIGVFALIAHRLGVAGGGTAFIDLISQLGRYAGTVIIGLLIHGLIVLPLILYLFTKRNPIEYGMNLSRAIATAFATASSSATLPMTMDCTEESGVSKKTGSVVLPLGATVNMDGTALYEAVAVIFIAQCYGISLQFPELIIIFFTATLAAIGAASIPEAGLVTMVLVLQSVGLPIDGIGIILAIDWFLDRCRTTVNVWGDAVGAAVIDKLESS